METTVAMELAASWKPFRKSKTRATKTMKIRKVVSVAIAGGADQAFLMTTLPTMWVKSLQASHASSSPS